jgi:hypothetical protein
VPAVQRRIVQDSHQLKKQNQSRDYVLLNNYYCLEIDDFDTKADTANLFLETFYDFSLITCAVIVPIATGLSN